MRILTVKQPWAAFIALGWKPIENRSWLPPPYLIGTRIGIHAGAHIPKHEETLEIVESLIDLYRADAARLGLPVTLGQWRALFEAQKGQVVATARLAGVAMDPPIQVNADDLTAAEAPWWAGPGQYPWRLAEVKRAKSPELKGMLGLWTLPTTLVVNELATETIITPKATVRP